jgi:2-keto-4-pentenoate hydratase/2-oxohepta-3-ene-1,7-dioic acid hydratase in catechol pathway
MHFSIPELIEYLSEQLTLQPGDVIATGTPAGVGHYQSPPRYLADGDVMRCEIEGIGAIENRVVDEAPRSDDHETAAGVDELLGFR